MIPGYSEKENLKRKEIYSNNTIIVSLFIFLAFACCREQTAMSSPEEIKEPATDTLIVYYRIDSTCVERNVQQVIYVTRTDTMYVESDSIFGRGLRRYWNLGELPDYFIDSVKGRCDIDSIIDSDKILIKDYAVRTRNTYIEHYAGLDSLKKMPIDSIHARYLLMSEYRCLIKREQVSPCFSYNRNFLYMPGENFQSPVWENYLGRNMVRYVWDVKDRISGVKLVLWYDMETMECIDGMLWEEYHLYASLREDYSKKIDKIIPEFFICAPLTEEELKACSRYYGMDVISYDYEQYLQRDRTRLMNMNMEDALRIIGAPVGAFMHKYVDNTDPSEKFWRYTTDTLSYIAESGIPSPIFWVPGFQSSLKKYFNSMKTPDIIELTWVCMQEIYTTVYYFEKNNIWTPCFVELWRDGSQY